MNAFQGPRDRPGRSTGSPPQTSGAKPIFTPQESDARLLDELAEKQADQMDVINSSQLRRFFGEVKDLYRRFDTRVASGSAGDDVYRAEIEPAFKMIRSKVSYAARPGGQSSIPPSFREFLDNGVKQVQTADHFRRFVMHFEAVVGFMYGKDKVRK